MSAMPTADARRSSSAFDMSSATIWIFCRTVRQGSSRGSWNMTPMRALSGTCTLPVKRSSRPATMRSSVVLPQPDGPISTVMLCGCTSSTRSRMAGIRVPSAPTWVFSSMRISNRLVAPAGRTSFKGLHQQIFDCEHDGDEGNGIAKDGRHVKKLEV